VCYHISNHQKQAVIKKKFKRNFKEENDFKEAYHINGFDKPLIPVISNENSTVIQLYRWRLVPEYVVDEDKFKANTLNARAEELFSTSSYKNYSQNRCLVICTGFFEPHKINGGKQTQSYYIKPLNESFFTLGAIWSKWKDQYTCSIVTVEASPLMKKIHNDGERMPLILQNDTANQWLAKDLDQEKIKSLMTSYAADDELEAYRVMDGIMNARLNTNIAQAIKPYNQPTQSNLF
jgi:putative SOS response-associated peptidase YedK